MKIILLNIFNKHSHEIDKVLKTSDNNKPVILRFDKDYLLTIIKKL